MWAESLFTKIKNSSLSKITVRIKPTPYSADLVLTYHLNPLYNSSNSTRKATQCNSRNLPCRRRNSRSKNVCLRFLSSYLCDSHCQPRISCRTTKLLYKLKSKPKHRNSRSTRSSAKCLSTWTSSRSRKRKKLSARGERRRMLSCRQVHEWWVRMKGLGLWKNLMPPSEKSTICWRKCQ